MKTLGLLGGMSWESTVLYYRAINEHVRTVRGGLHSAPLVLHSYDFESIAALQRAGDWAAAADALGAGARGLVRAGAQAIVICTNTMHCVAPQVQAAAGVPLLHIGDATGHALRAAGVTRAGLLGTRFSMEQPFLHEHLQRHHGVQCITPDAAERDEVHRIIFDELCQGRTLPPSRASFRRIMAGLVQRGAQAVVLGCTEIGLLVDAGDATVPLFDTTTLHARHAADWALGVETLQELPA